MCLYLQGPPGTHIYRPVGYNNESFSVLMYRYFKEVTTFKSSNNEPVDITLVLHKEQGATDFQFQINLSVLIMLNCI